MNNTLRSKHQKRIISILLIGSSISGKTIMIKQYHGPPFEQTIIPSGNTFITNSFEYKHDNKAENILVKIWNSPDTFINLNTINVSQGIMLLYDITDHHDFIKLESMISKVKEAHDISTFPLIIVGNKIDLAEQRVVPYEQGKALADKYNLPYFETSAKKGTGVKEAFDALINAACFYGATIKVDTAISDNNDSDDDDFNTNEMRVSGNEPQSHFKDSSVSGLKNLIAKIESEKDLNEMTKKIKAIEVYLEEMKPTKFDLNYQKYFSMLFRRIEMIQSKEEKRDIYVNIFLQLKFVFAEQNWNFYNKGCKVLTEIESMSDIEKKKKFYLLYTKEFSYDSIPSNSIIKLYNFFFNLYIKDIDQFIKFLNEFTSIILSLNKKLLNIKNQNLKTGRNSESPYIITAIESFCDVFLYLLTRGYISDANLIISLISNLFPVYFKINKNFQICDKDILYKIVVIFCLLYSTKYYDNKLTDKFLAVVKMIFEDNTKICIANLYHILTSAANQTAMNKSAWVHILSKKIYYHYFSLILEREVNEENRTKMIHNSFLKDYDDFMNNIPGSNTMVNVHRGCVLLFTYLYSKNVKLLATEEDCSYSSFFVLRELHSIIQNEQREQKCLYYFNQEILKMISVLITVKHKEFNFNEWRTIINSIIMMMDNARKKKYTCFFFQECLPIIDFISNHCDIFVNNFHLCKGVHTIITNLLATDDLENFSLLIFKICHSAIEKCYYEYVEPYVLIGIKELMIVSTEKEEEENSEEEEFSDEEGNHSDEKENEETPGETNRGETPQETDRGENEERIEDKKYEDIVFNMLIDIIRNKGEKEVVREVVIKNYKMMIEKLSRKEYMKKNEKNEIAFVLNESFIKLISLLISVSDKKYKELLDIVFAYPSQIDNEKEYSAEEIKFIEKMTNYFLSIYNNLLLSSNCQKNKNLLGYLLELSLSKRIYYDIKRENVQGSQLNTISLMSLLISKMKINANGLIFFSTIEQDNSICHCRTTQEGKNDIDIDSVLSNYIELIASSAEFTNIDDYRNKYDKVWNSFKLYKSELNYSYEIMEIALNSLYLFNKENLLHILQVYLHIINIRPKKNDSEYNYSSIINFIISCNYLLNFQSEKYYLSSIDSQSNESLFSFGKEINLKDSLLSSLIDFASSSNIQIDYNLYTLLSFYLNSTLDQHANINKDNQTFTSINSIVLHLLSLKCDIRQNFILLFFLYHLKEILKYSESYRLINFIYIILLLSRSSKSIQITACLKDYISITPMTIELPSDLSPAILPFYYHFSDIICLYYVSYLAQKKDSDTAEKFLTSLLNLFNKDKSKTDRDIIFEAMLNAIIRCNIKRSNINEKELTSSLNEYTIISGNNNKIFCINGNNAIEITSVSSIRYDLSFKFSSLKEKVIKSNESKVNGIANIFSRETQNTVTECEDELTIDDNAYYNFMLKDLQKEENIERIKEKQKLVSSLLTSPLLLTYHVNVFFYPKENETLNFDDLVSEIDSDDVSPLFYKFIAQLGNLYINEEGEKVFAYKDDFYNIIFDFVNVKETKEERIELIKRNSVNLIWIDNPYTDTPNLNSLFDSLTSENENFVITVTPKSETHFLISSKYNEFLQKGHQSYKMMNINLSIEEYLCQNYYINITAQSSIRYLINSLVVMSDWAYYLSKKNVLPYQMKGEHPIQPKVIANCFYVRLQLIKKLNLLK